MKLRALLVCVLTIATLSDSRLGAQNAPAAVQETELPQTWLEGSIGPDAVVQLFIESAGWPKKGGLWGICYYTKYWTPISLDGEWVSPGRIVMNELDPVTDAPSGARFDLQLSADGAVTGTWISVDGRRLPVRVRRVAQPAAFEIAIQKARRFAQPPWPVEITYPEGWFFQATDTSLVLRSPDPHDMFFDNELRCERGRGLPPVPAEREEPIPFHEGFYRAHDGWRVQVTSLVDAELSLPKTRTMGSVTFMSAETAYRAHNAWGYSGIREAKAYLVIDGDEWVYCVDRLLDTEGRIRPRSSPASQTASLDVEKLRILAPTWLDGTIGNAMVRVFVQTNVDGPRGVYYYTRYRTAIPLDGDWVSDTMIRMHEGHQLGTEPRPQLDLQLTDQGGEGTWSSPDGRQLPVRLRRVAQSAAFGIAIQKPRRFADPAWPVEISYPEGWFLQVADTSLLLRSPDPRDMLFHSELECERGRGLLPPGGFYHTPTGWQVEGDVVPKTRVMGSATFMSAALPYRRDGQWGGYVRQYLAIEGDEWVHCYDRLLDSEDRIQPRRR
jgi:hypothetical protein